MVLSFAFSQLNVHLPSQLQEMKIFWDNMSADEQYVWSVGK